MKIIILAVIFAAVPAAAQTFARVPVSGLKALPGLGATPMVVPASPAEMTARILGASFDTARLGPPPLLPNAAAFNPLAPTPAIPAELIRPFSAAPAPVADSPLRVIGDASADATQKAAALDRLFENYAPAAPEALAVSVQPSAAAPESSNEFSQAPAWFDTAQVKFASLIKAGTGGAGGTAVLRYGWRSQYDLVVFASPGNPSILFREYALNPMAPPKQSFDATLETAAARKAAAKILRAAQERNPVSGKDMAALDEILAFLEGRQHE